LAVTPGNQMVPSITYLYLDHTQNVNIALGGG
jgi:hypothetical protein